MQTANIHMAQSFMAVNAALSKCLNNIFWLAQSIYQMMVLFWLFTLSEWELGGIGLSHSHHALYCGLQCRPKCRHNHYSNSSLASPSVPCLKVWVIQIEHEIHNITMIVDARMTTYIKMTILLSHIIEHFPSDYVFLSAIHLSHNTEMQKQR